MRQLNSSVSATTGKTPFELLYGSNLGTAFDRVKPDTSLQHDVLQERAFWVSEASDAIAWANDRRRRRLSLEPGMKAYLVVGKGYKLPGKPKHPKFQLKRHGPYEILRILGHGNAVELKMPPGSRIHPIVSIEQIEPLPKEPDPFDRPTNNTPPAMVTADDNEQAPERILDKRFTARRTRGAPQVTEYLVQ